jgi:hypothetical protein
LAVKLQKTNPSGPQRNPDAHPASPKRGRTNPSCQAIAPAGDVSGSGWRLAVRPSRKGDQTKPSEPRNRRMLARDSRSGASEPPERRVFCATLRLFRGAADGRRETSLAVQAEIPEDLGLAFAACSVTDYRKKCKMRGRRHGIDARRFAKFRAQREKSPKIRAGARTIPEKFAPVPEKSEEIRGRELQKSYLFPEIHEIPRRGTIPADCSTRSHLEPIRPALAEIGPNDLCRARSTIEIRPDG